MVDAKKRNRVELLAEVPLFSGFSTRELARLAALCGEVSYRKGEIVCRQGEAGDALFVIVSGELEVWAGEPARRLSRLGPGEFVGEMTLLLGGARTATVQASRRATLLTLDKASFDRFFGHNPKALESLSRVLCQRLISTSRNEVRARATTVIGIVAAEGLKGKTLVATALAGLLQDMSGREAVLVRLVPHARGRRGADVPPSLVELARAPERIGGLLGQSGRDPAALAGSVRAADDGERLVEALGTLAARLGERFPFVVVDPGVTLASLPAALAETCDVLVEIVASAVPGDAGRHDGAETTTYAVVNRFNDASRPLAINHCEPFVLPIAPALAGLDPFVLARRIRDDAWSAAARPLHRLARKILGTSVGIALGGGAAFGLAHIGIFAAFEESGVPIDVVAGSSMGSIIALAYARGMRAHEMIEIARHDATAWKTISALDFTLTKPGILSGNRLVRIFRPMLEPARSFEDLVVPCRTVAVDIESGERVCIGSGSLEMAFRASCAVPMLWSPVRHEGRVLADGGVIDPVPAEVVHEMGADVVIGVNAVPQLKRGVSTVLSRLYRTVNRFNPLSYLGGGQGLPSMFDVVMNALQTLEHELGNFKAISADVRINPALSHLTWIEFYKPDELIAAGRAAAEAALPDVRRVLARKLAPYAARGDGGRAVAAEDAAAEAGPPADVEAVDAPPHVPFTPSSPTGK